MSDLDVTTLSPEGAIILSVLGAAAWLTVLVLWGIDRRRR
jgi:hypothetical protein